MNYFELTLGAAAITVNSYAVFAVCRQRPHSWTSRLLVVFWALISAYVVTNYLSINPPSHDLPTQLFWIRLVMAVTSFIFPVLVALTAVMPGKGMTLRPWQLAVLATIGVIGAYLSMSPDGVFPTLSFSKGIATPHAGPGMAYSAANYIGSYALSVVICLRRYRRTVLAEKPFYLYYVIGLSVSFILMMVAAVVATNVFQSTRTVFLAPLVWSVFFVFAYFLFPEAQEKAERR